MFDFSLTSEVIQASASQPRRGQETLSRFAYADTSIVGFGQWSWGKHSHVSWYFLVGFQRQRRWTKQTELWMARRYDSERVATTAPGIHTLWPHKQTLHPSGKAACSPVTLRIYLFTLLALNITSWTLGSPSLWWHHPVQLPLSCNEKPPKLFRGELSCVEPHRRGASGKTPRGKFLKLHNSRLR